MKSKLPPPRKLGTFLIAALLIWGCQNERSFEQEPTPESVSPSKLITLGKKLENPYSVKNMKIALQNINSNGQTSKTSTNFDVTTTHLYLKFKPKTEAELDILKTDETLILYTYPLDYELDKIGDYYRDPTVPANQPTYQYCAVPVNKVLPNNVAYEVLEELFIPDEYSDTKPTGKKIPTGIDVDALVDEALRITHNLSKTGATPSLTSRKSKWRPAGTIKVWDDVLNTYIGVEGVRVRARRWFTTHTGIANASGYYSCDGEFRQDANYSIDWERYDFALQDGWLNGATYNGPKITGNWDLNLKADEQAYYATIFRAANHYYYKDIKGLRRPPQNSFWKTQLKIRASYQKNDYANGSHNPSDRFLGLGSAIKIYNPQHKSDEIYATVTHELAHASHWNMDRDSYKDAEAKVAESWARGVQWELTRMVYSNYKGRKWLTNFKDYTLVVADMIDNSSTDNTNLGFKSPEDDISGYTIKQIEDALIGIKKWNDWKNNIKNKYNNATKTNLDKLFKAYE